MIGETGNCRSKAANFCHLFGETMTSMVDSHDHYYTNKPNEEPGEPDPHP